jgi:uncharacterized protein (DUF2141 family)
MRKRLGLLLTLLLSVSLSLAGDPRGATDDANRLTIRIDGLSSTEGRVAARLFDSKESYRGRAEPLRSALLEVRGSSAEWVLDDLPRGTYAAAVYHDRNGNGMLDRGPLGVPSEPYGFSNDARGKFGPPAFGKVKFVVDEENDLVAIRVR